MPTDHKEQPAIYQDGTVLEPISEEMKKGLELAASICRLYGDGERWAEVILSYGEQQRARLWMQYEAKQRSADAAATN